MGANRTIKKRRIYSEALNPSFGYFYTIKKTLKKTSTKYQDIEFVDTDEFGKTLLLDGITQTVEKNDYMYHEPMVHPAMCRHHKPENILVVGGGDGGIISEVLKYPTVKRVELAELDEGVVRFSKKYLGSVHKNCFDDPRVNVNIVDGRKFTEEHPGEFDVVIMDMTDPFGPSVMLYTREFFKAVKRSMRDKSGIFVMHTESPITRPAAFACIQKTLRSVFGGVDPFYQYIQMYGVLWSITTASDYGDDVGRGAIYRARAKNARGGGMIDMKSAFIDKKLEKFGIKGLKMYNGNTHAAMLTPYPYISDVLKTRTARVITDNRPEFPDNFL